MTLAYTSPQFIQIEHQQIRWHSEAGLPAPKRVQRIDDTMSADVAYRLACEGTALLWQGDFQGARQMLAAMTRRLEAQQKEKTKKIAKNAAKNLVENLVENLAEKTGNQAESKTAESLFNLHRQRLGQRARVLNCLLISMRGDHSVALKRAPDAVAAVKAAVTETVTTTVDITENSDYVLTLRELLGMIGAYEWRKAGVAIAALDGRHIHAHYGVFAPLRAEYLHLVATAPLPKSVTSFIGTTGSLAYDIGTGTGVLAAILATRGMAKIIATDTAPRALVCATENITNLGLADKVTVLNAHLFPEASATGQIGLKKADLIVCNPPWIPARPSSPLESAVYDPDSQMLRGFLAGAGAHLSADGEAWLILSDLAEHLHLRSRAELLGWINDAGLKVLGRQDAKPNHPKVIDESDFLHAARKAETTSLWRLGIC